MWGNLFVKIFQEFSYWVNRTCLRGRPLEFNTLKDDDIMEWYIADFVYHDTYCHNREFPKSFEPKDWVNWEKYVYTYLYTVLNSRDVPLTYVVCKGNRPLNNFIEIYEEIVWCYPIPVLAFNVDTNTVIILLK